MVLWIVLAVLAVIVLLLCFPVTLRLSWWPTEQDIPFAGYRTQQVEKDLQELSLLPEDEAVLLELIDKLPPPAPQPQKELTVVLKVLFLHFTLYPFREKKEASPPKKKQSPKREESQEQKEKKGLQKEDWAGIYKMLPQVLGCLKRPLEQSLGDVCLKVQLWATVVRSDSAQSTLAAQKICMAMYTLLGAVQNWIQVKRADIRLRPDFTGCREEDDWSVKVQLSVHPIVQLAAALRFGFGLLKLLLRSKAKRQAGRAPKTSSEQPAQ